MGVMRWLLGTALAAGLLLLVSGDAHSLMRWPRPLAVFAAFWLVAIGYSQHLATARWFDRRNYGNLVRMLIPAMAFTGAAAALLMLGGAAHGHPLLRALAQSDTSLGVGLIGLVVTVGLPYVLSHRTRVRGGPQSATDYRRPTLEDVVDRSLELHAEQQPSLERADMRDMADVLGVSEATLEQAHHQLEESGIIRSRPPPRTKRVGAAKKDE